MRYVLALAIVFSASTVFAADTSTAAADSRVATQSYQSSSQQAPYEVNASPSTAQSSLAISNAYVPETKSSTMELDSD